MSCWQFYTCHEAHQKYDLVLYELHSTPHMVNIKFHLLVDHLFRSAFYA